MDAPATEAVIADTVSTLSEEIRIKQAENTDVDKLGGVPLPTTTNSWSWRRYFKVKWLTLQGEARNLRFFVLKVEDSDNVNKNWDDVHLYITALSYRPPGVIDEEGGNIWAFDADDGEPVPPIPPDGRTIAPIHENDPWVVKAGVVLKEGDIGLQPYGDQNYVILQVRVGPDALPGEKVARNCYYRWDEVF